MAGAKVTEHVRTLNLNLGLPFEIYNNVAHWFGERIAYTWSSHSEADVRKCGKRTDADYP